MHSSVLSVFLIVGLIGFTLLLWLEQYQYLKISKQDRILTIRLNRQDKRNAFHPELVKEITKVYTSCADDDSLRAVILEAEGEVFSAGADLGYLRSLKDNDYETNLIDSQAIELCLR